MTPTRLLVALLAALTAVALPACADQDRPAQPGASSPSVVTEAQANHVHGLGINPRDGALFVATHSGLFRAARGQDTARRVGDSRQDTMGFSVVGPDRFVGSGHPDVREGGPPVLGLIASSDAGRSWRSVALRGQADFHVLETSGDTIYGVDGATLLVSVDAGRSWQRRLTPGPAIDLAISPRTARELVVATPEGLYASSDGARSFRPLSQERVGLLAWTARRELQLVDAGGAVGSSSDGGRSWTTVGAIGGRPVAFTNAGDRLLAATVDGTIVESGDGGRTWRARLAM